MKITNACMQAGFTLKTVYESKKNCSVWRVTEINRRTEAVEMSFLRSAASVILHDVEVKKGVELEAAM
jgi:hypothetical protein